MSRPRTGLYFPGPSTTYTRGPLRLVIDNDSLLKMRASTIRFDHRISYMLAYGFAVLLALVLRSTARVLTSPLGPVIDLGYAAYAGNTTTPTGVTNGPVAFYGNIRYAQPPLRDLRFRAPKMLNEKLVTTHVDDARNWGPMCIQRPAVVGVGTEDCLNLNVWKPTNATSNSKLAVAVYIHGGGFYYNSHQGFPMYDWVAQHQEGLVAVSMGYRLTLLGFLGGSSVAADGDLNAGLLDQRAALDWIQRHISKFGGDPDNVTIYGESAGAGSVVMHMVAYGGEKPIPFHRAAAQSIGYGPTRTTDQIESAFTDAAVFVGCPTSGKKAMDCLRSASIGALVGAINHVPNGAFAPVIDRPSGFLPDLPSRLISAGKFQSVDFVGGHCKEDGKTFVGGQPSDFQSDDDIRRRVFPRWPGVSNSTIDKALALYPSPDAPGSPFATHWDRAWTIAGEIIFTCMDWFVAEQIMKRGTNKVYSYRWDAADSVLYNAAPYKGAQHTSDIYFLFQGTNPTPNAGATFTPFNASEAVLASEAIRYWTSFAATGDPSSSKKSTSPAWGVFAASDTDDTRNRLILARGDDSTTLSVMEAISADEISRCKFWMNEDVLAETRV